MHAENSEPPARSLVLLLVVNFPNFHENMRIRMYDSQKPLLLFCHDRRDENEYTNDAKLSPSLLRFNDAYSNASPSTDCAGDSTRRLRENVTDTFIYGS